jgi:hypothetical protein
VAISQHTFAGISFMLTVAKPQIRILHAIFKYLLPGSLEAAKIQPKLAGGCIGDI